MSEMDVRSLKTLYDPNGYPLSARPTGPEVFTVEAFAARVQALIADDRALIERLIRFAQAHDLLKKNAERAQKLAQESNAALETYQKQVKLFEDRNVTMIAKQTALYVHPRAVFEDFPADALSHTGRTRCTPCKRPSIASPQRN